jgi:hypothetical protein
VQETSGEQDKRTTQKPHLRPLLPQKRHTPPPPTALRKPAPMKYKREGKKGHGKDEMQKIVPLPEVGSLQRERSERKQKQASMNADC